MLEFREFRRLICLPFQLTAFVNGIDRQVEKWDFKLRGWQIRSSKFGWEILFSHL